jgi:catechol 2,3-dioxygenase-like lactoylglutathione lyase family enzyme
VTLRVSRVLETCLYAADLRAAAAFYRDILGLEPISSVPGRHAFFRCGDGVLLLFDPARTAIPGGDVPPHGAHGPGHVAFAVPPDELPAWPARLAAHAVTLEADVAWPGGGRSLYLRDPAGNSVELTTPRIWGNEDGA